MENKLPMSASTRYQKKIPSVFGWATRDFTRVGSSSTQIDDIIVAKRATSAYEDNARNPHWIKIKNPAYSQKDGRADLFKRAG
jgi:hypothetical protein